MLELATDPGGMVDVSGDRKRMRSRADSANPADTQKSKTEPTIDPVDKKSLPNLRGSELINPRSRERNQRTQEAMTDTNGDVAMTAEKSASSTAAKGHGETGVDYMNKPELGILTETRTAILPYTAYISMNKINPSIPVWFKIRMNCPYDIWKDTSIVAQTAGAAVSRGISRSKCPVSQTNDAALGSYPRQLAVSGSSVDNANNFPAWIKWYEKMYEVYHTIETQYRITFAHASKQVGSVTDARDVILCHEWDAYSGSSTGNVMPLTQDSSGVARHVSSAHMQTWKRINNLKVDDQYTNSRDVPETKVLSGVWKPGTKMMNTANEEDIKAWYPVGAEPGAPNPAWVEQLVVAAYLDAFASEEANVHVKVELRYIVQFKDLKGNLRYVDPLVSTANAVTLRIGPDTEQKPGPVTATV